MMFESLILSAKEMKFKKMKIREKFSFKAQKQKKWILKVIEGKELFLNILYYEHLKWIFLLIKCPVT